MPKFPSFSFRAKADSTAPSLEPDVLAEAGLGLAQLAYSPQAAIQSERACMVMAEYIATTLKRELVDVSPSSGAAVRIAMNDYAIYPSLEAQPELAQFALALHKLDVDVAYCFGSEMVKTICQTMGAGMRVISLDDNTHVQVVDTMAE